MRFVFLFFVAVLSLPFVALAALYDDADLARPISTQYPLSADYAPADLVRAADFGITTRGHPDHDEMKIRLAQDQSTSDSRANMPSRLRDLMFLCEEETGEKSALGSGYRSYDTQAIIHWNRKGQGTAAPGTSEHQAGLAVDIAVDGAFLSARSPTYACFLREAWKYGFILSYPAGNAYLGAGSLFEPWHWRYVGLDAARLLFKYGKADYPAEFLEKIAYFSWLDSHGFEEDLPSLRRALARHAEMTDAADPRARAFSARVHFLSERVFATLAAR